MKKPKPIIRSNNGKQHLTSWIIENFPVGYQDLEYCDIRCGNAIVFLNKDRSVREILNDSDIGIAVIYRALRDEPKEIVSRLKRLKYCNKTFDKAIKRSMELFDDYVDHAINEIILHKFGKQKKVFDEKGEKVWLDALELFPSMSERLQNIVVLNESFQNLIKIWNEEGMFLYLESPNLPLVIDGVVKTEENTVSVEEHVKFLNHVNDSGAKVLISGYYNTLYKRHLVNWKCLRKKALNQKIKDRKYDCLWMNY